MNKEPIGLYIFRFVLGLALFAFMCMLYWSSVLIEENLKALRFDVALLKNDIFNLTSETNKARSDIIEGMHQAGSFRIVPAPVGSKEEQKNVQGKISDSTPNLLEEDPFFTKTLPELLGANFKPKGVRRSAIFGKPDNLHPFTNWSQVESWLSLCTVSVAKLKFGKYETFAPNMAVKVEERKNKETGLPEFWVFLRDHVYWQPLSPRWFSEDIHLAPQFLRKNQVTAEDFKFYYDAMMNPHIQEAGAVALRTYYNELMDFEVIDKLTFVVRWKTSMVPGDDGKEVPRIKYVAKQLTGQLRPLASFVYKYFPDGRKIIEEDSEPNAYRTNTVWAQNFSQHWAKNIIVSCGPWSFDGMTDRQIKFKRNADFYFPLAALSEALEVDIKDTPDAMWQDFMENRLDSHALDPNQIVDLEKFLTSDSYKKQASQGYKINRLDYLIRSFSYIGWNQAKQFFKSSKVRRAMTMAIDRPRIIQQNLNGMGIEINGPFYRFSPDYDDSIIPWPFNLQAARQLLEEEGWYDRDGSGVISKEIDGKIVPFRFSLTYYVKNPTSKTVCEFIATTLKMIGIICNLNGVDMADLSASFDDKSFDALCLGWMLGAPPEDPRQLWSSKEAKIKGSSNAVGFENAEVDAIIEKLTYEYNRAKRRALYLRFNAIMHEEQPYTFLYIPKTAFLYREYLQNVFLPIDRQDLVPGADIAEPDPNIFWLKP